jgi:threonine aldolase
MRQAGILAAAGLHALDRHRARLNDDHRNAARLAAGLRALGHRVEAEPETNIVMFHVADPLAFWRAAGERKVRFNPPSGTRIRAVTHRDVDAADMEEALARLAGCPG